ncbi:uncharacterized protein Z520_06390 [Fonsecaea multimorphosa CBS 102226]|uniref:Xylanolytic transcriptional activator regulatory domain-containing protein n=1 Tax=Fonsecaea multimorphosa CBS 102226 TaxID=1442371 RepID=A0A0D2JVW7_9EURO|nr:uncharacterized protein Z520_06390 [Fonsecaea multimorphosa CBS 102226]KIX97612.1 hypothetical protein Z520_06390 [Fonsecaea multimorphosa CBS 102226]
MPDILAKCDGAVPICGQCAELSIECTYTHLPKSCQSYAQSALEDRFKSIEDALRQLANRSIVASSINATCTLLSPSESSRDTNLIGGVLPSGPTDADVDHVDGMALIDSADQPHARYFGSSSNVAFLREVSRATTTMVTRISPTRLRALPSSTRPLVSRAPSPTADQTRDGIRPKDVIVAQLPSEDRVLHWLELYFSDTGILYPFISEQRVRSGYNSLKEQNFGSITRPFLGLLSAIFAVSILVKADPSCTISQNTAEADVYFHRSLSLASESALHSTDIETVQCLLLLSQYCQGTQRPDEGWALHGLAVRTAMRLGLHSSSHIQDTDQLAQEIRKRVWFNCFLLDRTLSMTLGRVQTVHDDYIAGDLPLDVPLDRLDGPPMMSAPRSIRDASHSASFFIETIKLYTILGSVINKLYSGNIHNEPPTELVSLLPEIVLLDSRLEQWRMNLPITLRLDPTVSLSPRARPSHSNDALPGRLNVMIHLRYLNLKILLHRPVLRVALHKLSAATSDAGDSKAFSEQLCKPSIKILAETAIELVDTVDQASGPVNLLGAWWFALYYTFNASLAIFACFLLELSRHGGQYKRAELDFISELATKLRLAINVTERVGNDALQAKRIAKVLTKLVAITTVMFGPSGHLTQAEDGPMRDNEEPRQQLPPDPLADSFQRHSFTPLDTIQVERSSAADMGFDLDGNGIFNAFEGLPTDWVDLNLYSFTHMDDLGGLDLAGAFTM